MKVGSVKLGDLIAKVVFNFKSDESQKAKLEVITDPIQFFSAENKYQIFAREVNKLVGNKNNYNRVYNFLTRLRFEIRDKSLVNEAKIKRLTLTKGIVWSGSEMQIIVGQDVYKLKDEVVKQNENSNAIRTALGVKTEKVSLIRKALATFAGIMVKIIPVIVGCGLFQAMIAIFIQAGIMPNIVFKLVATPGANDVLISEAPVGWIILFAMGKTSTYFLGIVIAISAANHFKLDTIMGGVIGLILCCPLVFLDGGPLGIGPEFPLYSFGTIDTGNPVLNNITEIKLTTMNTKIIVIILAFWTAKKIDTWVKGFIPIALELMFRTFIILAIVIPLSFFGYGLAWNFLEVIFGALIYWASQIPLGVGAGIYSAIWQLAVVFGLHIVLAIIAMLDSYMNGAQTIFIHSLSVYAQLGALIGVIIITQNAKLRKQALGMIPAGVLGITEPIIYGVNLPKKRPLIAGFAAAFFAGAFANILNVTARASSGIGIFEAIGFFSNPVYDPNAGVLSPVENGLFYILSCVVSIGLGILFSALTYKERVTEKTLLSKTLSKVVMLTSIQFKLDKIQKTELKTEVKKITNSIDKNR